MMQKSLGRVARPIRAPTLLQSRLGIPKNMRMASERNPKQREGDSRSPNSASRSEMNARGILGEDRMGCYPEDTMRRIGTPPLWPAPPPALRELSGAGAAWGPAPEPATVEMQRTCRPLVYCLS